jgi:molecular chaperone Hsp33
LTEDGAASGIVELDRRLLNDRGVVVTTGDFTGVIDAWHRHCRLWQEEPDGFSSVLMHQGLAAVALHLANRPNDEMVGWTLNLHQPPTNVFLTGDVRKGTFTGRVYTEGVRTENRSRLFVQTYRPSLREPFQSAIDVTGFDVMEIFEQYYERSEQNPARFYELDGNRYGMVLGLPGVDRSWIQGIGPESLSEHRDSGKPIDGRVFRFECGCSPVKMLRALRSMFHSNPGELFRGEERVETSCPRCGRRWWLTLDQFRAEEEAAG